jgi:hypothetical protein
VTKVGLKVAWMEYWSAEKSVDWKVENLVDMMVAAMVVRLAVPMDLLRVDSKVVLMVAVLAVVLVGLMVDD